MNIRFISAVTIDTPALNMLAEQIVVAAKTATDSKGKCLYVAMDKSAALAAARSALLSYTNTVFPNSAIALLEDREAPGTVHIHMEDV